uniref:Uncharacterized protein n=1 Tax=Knipowitschia caucasica TaxID=637954 RepID=A0AAV2M953_KNICA
MSGSGSGPGSDYDEGELVEPCEEDAQSSYSQEVGQRERYPLDRFSHLTASAVVRMRMAMPVQPASPPVDYLQSLAPSPRRRRPSPSSAGSSSHGTASGLCGAKNP